MKCIILAAGQGKRIKCITNKIPKCLIKINNESILERQIRFLNKYNIKDIIVVKGFKEKKIKLSSINYIINKNFKNSEQLDSLFCASKELDQDVLITFSDIIYDFSIIKDLTKSKNGEIILAVDKKWKNRYKFRYDHPYEQADKVKINNKGEILKIGKAIKLEETNGEFLGILRLSKKGFVLSI